LATVRYLGTAGTSKSYTLQEIKSRILGMLATLYFTTFCFLPLILELEIKIIIITRTRTTTTIKIIIIIIITIIIIIILINKFQFNAILHFLLNGYETWSLVLREEGKLWVFWDTGLKKILGLKTEYVSGRWSNSDEELSNFYSSSTILLSLYSSTALRTLTAFSVS
jgi:hypothetical protein